MHCGVPMIGMNMAAPFLMLGKWLVDWFFYQIHLVNLECLVNANLRYEFLSFAWTLFSLKKSCRTLFSFSAVDEVAAQTLVL
jgi:hypothetical protein